MGAAGQPSSRSCRTGSLTATPWFGRGEQRQCALDGCYEALLVLVCPSDHEPALDDREQGDCHLLRGDVTTHLAGVLSLTQDRRQPLQSAGEDIIDRTTKCRVGDNLLVLHEPTDAAAAQNVPICEK